MAMFNRFLLVYQRVPYSHPFPTFRPGLHLDRNRLCREGSSGPVGRWAAGCPIWRKSGKMSVSHGKNAGKWQVFFGFFNHSLTSKKCFGWDSRNKERGSTHLKVNDVNPNAFESRMDHRRIRNVRLWDPRITCSISLMRDACKGP